MDKSLNVGPESGEDDLTYLWKLTGLDREVPIPWENRRSVRSQPSTESRSQSLGFDYLKIN